MKKTPDDAKYISADKFNKFLGAIFDENFKKATLATNKNLADVEQPTNENKKKRKLRKMRNISFKFFYW